MSDGRRGDQDNWNRAEVRTPGLEGTSNATFRVAIPTGSDSPATISCVSRLLALPGVRIAGVIYDRGVFPFNFRLKRAWRRVRQEGATHSFVRVFALTSGLARRILTRPFDAGPLRRAIFPDEIRSLRGLCVRHKMPHFAVDSLNGPEARAELVALDADLGIVIETRILKRETFGIPRLGCIDPHKGKVPQYRGQPPAFWKLYNGEKEAGVTSHFADDKLGTQNVVMEGAVAIAPSDIEHSLTPKLHQLAASLLSEAVQAIVSGRG